MPRPRKNKNYFGEAEEAAVVAYLTAETFEEKNRIYNQSLRKPLEKMVESIIRRYKLYRKDFDFEGLHTDVSSFLITKVDKFDPSKGTKAYSYFGTICKNYLMGAIQKDQKELNRKISYEDISSSVEERPEMSYHLHNDALDYEDVVKRLVKELEEFMEVTNLNKNEEKLGYALIEVFSNYEEIFQSGDGNKFNKNLILLSLREMTSMTTKEIRTSMKKYKKIYEQMMLKVIKL
jgi:hypothetical protein